MLLIILIGTVALNGTAHTGSLPWQPAEHRQLADSALRVVLSELGPDVPRFREGSASRIDLSTPVRHGLSFGRLAERLAKDDGSAARFQEAGRTVYEQLAELSEADIEGFWQEVSRKLDAGEEVDLADPGADNVVANYLLAHLAALRLAEAAASEDARSYLLHGMLAYEALAQGFLADAHASGHLLVPRHDMFQSLHPVNNGRAHDAYNSSGVFVINGHHQAWQAFGDGLLTWYARPYRQVLTACEASLREVFLVYFARRGRLPEQLRAWVRSFTDVPASDLASRWLAPKDGQAYYESDSGLPGLNYVPMPASATWSLRRPKEDGHGSRIRKQYPQFREPGLHDPHLLPYLKSRLYSQSAFPRRFIPPELVDSVAVAVAAERNRDAASVEYVQEFEPHPDFSGLVVEIGTGMLADDERSVAAVSGRVGYGIAENVLVASQLSVNTGITLPFDADQATPATIVAGLNPAGLPIHVEAGYATTTEDLLDRSAFTLAAAYEVATETLGFTFVGVSFRLRYGVMFFDEILHSASIQVAFY